MARDRIRRPSGNIDWERLQISFTSELPSSSRVRRVTPERVKQLWTSFSYLAQERVDLRQTDADQDNVFSDIIYEIKGDFKDIQWERFEEQWPFAVMVEWCRSPISRVGQGKHGEAELVASVREARSRSNKMTNRQKKRSSDDVPERPSRRQVYVELPTLKQVRARQKPFVKTPLFGSHQ